MAFKFAIGNFVEVPVKFSTNDGGKVIRPSVTLICKRLEEKEMKERLEHPDLPVKDFMIEITTGWKGQSFLVDDETGQPAEFSGESLAMLLSFPGLANLAFTTYLAEQGAKGKN